MTLNKIWSSNNWEKSQIEDLESEQTATLRHGIAPRPIAIEPNGSLLSATAIAKPEVLKQDFPRNAQDLTAPKATDDPEVWYDQGNSYRQIGNLEAALVCYNQAIELQPHKQEAWASLGWVLVRLSRSSASRCSSVGKSQFGALSIR